MMDIYATAVLRRVLENLDQPASHLLDAYFPLEQTSDSEEIFFDVDESKPRLTPFVSPLRAGVIVDDAGFTTKSFRPAYAKDKRKFSPDTPLRRAIGEQIGGVNTPAERRMAALGRSMNDQLKMLTRREEVMASEAMRTGAVTVEGDGYPSVTVDFGRAAGLTKSLTGAAAWGQTGVKPLELLEAWASDVQIASGAVSPVVTMDPQAWRLFRNSASVEKYLEYRRGTNSTLSADPQARGQGSDKARYVGSIGDFEFWVYQDVYVDGAGATQQMLPDNTVIMGGSGIEGTRAYGCIQDERAGYSAQRYFVKSWLEEDPAVRFLLLQSAPLVVPYRVNATLCATVA